LAVTLLSGMGLHGAVLSLLVSHAIIMVAMLALVVGELGLRRPDFSRVREFLGFGVPMIPGDLSDWALISSDRYLIGLILGVAFVGYYNPGYGLAVMILMMVNPLRFLLPSVLAVHFDSGGLDRVRSYLRASLKYFLLLAIPASVGLGLLSRDLLLALTTPEIASEGYMVTPILAVAMVLYGARVILAQVLIVEKQTQKLGSVMAVTAVLNIVMNLVLLPWMGIMGAAFSTLASFGFALVATGRLSSSYIHVEVDLVAVGKVLLATALMGFVLWLMVLNDLQEGLVGIIGAISVGVGVYFGATLLLGTLSKREYRFFWGLLRGETIIDDIE
ncbi:MAG: polysaccharide biosynthesis C-terminal domain-containing protein, partial [Thermoplasmata archaeon]|nr:polysaccharide biosynthesis C-terminal domain-containing protein [Thermoplasmata archaeon]